MVVVVEYPIGAHVDNIGDILLSDKPLVSQRMKHIYVCYNFICDYVVDRTVKIKIFCSEENPEEPFTKNISNGQFYLLTSR